MLEEHMLVFRTLGILLVCMCNIFPELLLLLQLLQVWLLLRTVQSSPLACQSASDAQLPDALSLSIYSLPAYSLQNLNLLRRIFCKTQRPNCR